MTSKEIVMNLNEIFIYIQKTFDRCVFFLHCNHARASLAYFWDFFSMCSLTAMKLLCFSVVHTEQELKILQSYSKILVQLKFMKKLSLTTMGQDSPFCIKMVYLTC